MWAFALFTQIMRFMPKCSVSNFLGSNYWVCSFIWWICTVYMSMLMQSPLLCGRVGSKQARLQINGTRTLILPVTNCKCGWAHVPFCAWLKIIEASLKKVLIQCTNQDITKLVLHLYTISIVMQICLPSFFQCRPISLLYSWLLVH